MSTTTDRKIARDKRSRAFKIAGASALSCSVLLGAFSISTAPSAFAAESKIGLGATESYSVLGGQTVTSTGDTILPRDLGVSPGTSITGFPPGLVMGSTHIADANAALAQSDLVKAYDDAASRQPTEIVEGDLVGRTLVGGVYKANEALELNGTVTLDAQGDPSAVWVFQVGSSLNTGSASRVQLTNGANACNIFWQVGSSATLGTGSNFKGSILANTSITVTTDTVVEGRALARNGAVTLDNNTFVAPDCMAEIPEDGETPVPVPTPTDTPTVEPTPQPSDEPTSAPTDAPSPEPTTAPTDEPTPQPTDEPTDEPTVSPTDAPTDQPTIAPSPEPSDQPTVEPTDEPTVTPTMPPGNDESPVPTDYPTIPGSNNQPPSEEPTDDSTYPTDGNSPEPTISITDGTDIEETDVRSEQEDELATTGSNSTVLFAGLGSALALLGGGLLFLGTKTTRTPRRH